MAIHPQVRVVVRPYGSVVPLAIFCIAMYGGLAFLLEDATGHAVLPLHRRDSSRETIEGDTATQLAGLESEPGVRKHL